MRPPHGPADLVEQGCMVLHRETGTVGVATRYYEPGQWTSPVNGKPVTAPVLELSTGDAFIVKDADTFVPLTAREADLFEMTTRNFATLIGGLAKAAAASGLPRETAVLLLQASLRQTAAALGKS